MRAAADEDSPPLVIAGWDHHGQHRSLGITTPRSRWRLLDRRRSVRHRADQPRQGYPALWLARGCARGGTRLTLGLFSAQGSARAPRAAPRASAALTRVRWVNACGMLPS